MSRYIVLTTINQGTANEYRKGEVAELTSAQVTALGSSNFRLVNNPSGSGGGQPGSPTHDTGGEAAGVSN